MLELLLRLLELLELLLWLLELLELLRLLLELLLWLLKLLELLLWRLLKLRLSRSCRIGQSGAAFTAYNRAVILLRTALRTKFHCYSSFP